MAEPIIARQAEIADLYFRTGSFQSGGEWKFSIHRLHPELPPSPSYLHYPSDTDPRDPLVADLFDLIGVEFHDICDELDIDPTHIGPIPNGSVPLGEELSKTYPEGTDRLARFTKHTDPDTDLVSFTGPEPDHLYVPGDKLVPIEDHLTAATNSDAFITVAENAGFVVNHLLCVVDRRQGGRQRLERRGIQVASILTLDTLLDHGVKHRHILRATAEETLRYRDANQF